MHLVDISCSSNSGSMWLIRGRLSSLRTVEILLERSGKVWRDRMGENWVAAPTSHPHGVSASFSWVLLGDYENAGLNCIRKKQMDAEGLG